MEKLIANVSAYRRDHRRLGDLLRSAEQRVLLQDEFRKPIEELRRRKECLKSEVEIQLKEYLADFSAGDDYAPPSPGHDEDDGQSEPEPEPADYNADGKAKTVEMREKLGREIRVFETSSNSQKPSQAPAAEEESDELTAADNFRLGATKKEGFRKIGEAEEAARRAKLTKAVMRVRFPDNHTFEATFHPSEKIQCLIDLLKSVLAHPDIPFYLYTTPTKKPIKDFSQDFYSAGFIAGAIVHFAHDQPKDDGASSSTTYLSKEILSLKVIIKAEEPEPSSEPDTTDAGPAEEERKA